MIRWIRDNATRAAIIVILVLVGLVLTLIDQFLSEAPGNAMPPVPEGQPDYVLEQASYTRYDTQGKRYQTLTSPHVMHLPEQQQTTATEPRITAMDDSAREWHISGHQGAMNEDGSRITLSGEALAVAPSEQWRLETDTLNYDRAQDRIWSDSASRFLQGDQVMRGDSFQALMTPKTLTLEGHVEGMLPQASTLSPSATSGTAATNTP